MTRKKTSLTRLIHTTCCRLGRCLLISGLVFAMLVSSGSGEAMVLHQHGGGRSHLHVLRYGDLLSNAALSPAFGHVSRPGAACRLASDRVRVVALIIMGSTLSGKNTNPAEVVLRHSGPAFVSAGLSPPPSLEPFSISTAGWVLLSATDDILLQDHILLI